ncbi:MAG: Mov34/MPN/PAD-1 family protein [Candidatus Micrarchaeia archaeon]|jgi:proteasome lid subunit RPN8/RPN11
MPSENFFEAYYSEQCVSKAQAHFGRAAQNRLEAMGLLVGKFCVHNGRPWVLCEDYITADNLATSVSVKFTRDSFQYLAGEFRAKRAGPQTVIVGWAHSHPGYGCFLSATDVSTQEKFFSHPQSIALVIDPTKREGTGMLKRTYRVRNGATEEVSFAVIRKK